MAIDARTAALADSARLSIIKGHPLFITVGQVVDDLLKELLPRVPVLLSFDGGNYSHAKNTQFVIVGRAKVAPVIPALAVDESCLDLWVAQPLPYQAGEWIAYRPGSLTFDFGQY